MSEIPYWLQAGLELASQPEEPLARFVPATVQGLLHLDCTLDNAVELTGKLFSNWGSHWNAARWNVTVRTQRNPDGSPRRFYRQGDRAYRVFESRQDFLSQWLCEFVPKFGSDLGKKFWNGEAWFETLLAGGYAKHAEIPEDQTLLVATLWAQHVLGVELTGTIDAVTRVALKAHQRQHSLPETGELTPATAAALFPARGTERTRQLVAEPSEST